jgi:hypothetical protein
MQERPPQRPRAGAGSGGVGVGAACRMGQRRGFVGRRGRVWGEGVEGSGPDLFWFFFREEAARVEVIEGSGAIFFSADRTRVRR